MKIKPALLPECFVFNQTLPAMTIWRNSTLQHIVIVLRVLQFLSFYSSKYRCCSTNKFCLESNITIFLKNSDPSAHTIVAEELLLFHFWLGKPLQHGILPLAPKERKERAGQGGNWPVLWSKAVTYSAKISLFFKHSSDGYEYSWPPVYVSCDTK